MEDPDRAGSYGTAKENAKSLYAKIGQVWCPSLEDWVALNSTGFRHLIEKKGIFRLKQEQKRRFTLLAHVADILKDPNIMPIHEPKETIHRVKSHGEIFLKKVPTDYWIFLTTVENRTVKLVVRQFKGKQKHFLTIYYYNQKENPFNKKGIFFARR